MISNIRRNIMGTTSFDGLFPGMRKAQDFTVYPVKSEQDAGRVTVQSDTRIGFIHMTTGTVTMSKPGGAYFIHLNGAQIIGTLPADDLLLLKAAIMGSAHGNAGTNGMVYTDNSGALAVFGAQS